MLNIPTIAEHFEDANIIIVDWKKAKIVKVADARTHPYHIVAPCGRYISHRTLAAAERTYRRIITGNC